MGCSAIDEVANQVAYMTIGLLRRGVKGHLTSSETPRIEEEPGLEPGPPWHALASS